MYPLFNAHDILLKDIRRAVRSGLGAALMKTINVVNCYCAFAMTYCRFAALGGLDAIIRNDETVGKRLSDYSGLEDFNVNWGSLDRLLNRVNSRPNNLCSCIREYLEYMEALREEKTQLVPYDIALVEFLEYDIKYGKKPCVYDS